MKVCIKIVFYLLLALLSLNNTTQAANVRDVVINELMWMGSTASIADEWIELRNMTGAPIDLSNWDITKNTGTEGLMLTIPSGILPANGYFLIANSAKDYEYAGGECKLNVDPDVVDASVSLSNDHLQIKIYDGPWDGGGTLLIDTAGDGEDPAYFGGDKTNKYSMERIDPPGDGTVATNWYTATAGVRWDEGATERGTPGFQNSPPPPAGSPGDMLINEIAPSESQDWIEFYNASGGTLDIEYRAIKEGNASIKAFSSYSMAVGEYIVLHFGGNPADDEIDTDANENGWRDFYAADDGLVATDNVISVVDGRGKIIDVLCFANQDANWTGSDTAANNGIDADQWAATNPPPADEFEFDCADWSDGKEGMSMARDASSTDNNDRDDWSVDATPTMGRNNGSSPISARIFNLGVSNDPFFVDGSDPTRADTTVSFNLAVDSEVSLRIYDAEGNAVRTLMDKSIRPSGKNEVIWDGGDGSGGAVPIGTYIICVEAVSLDNQSTDEDTITVTVARSVSGDDAQCFIATAAFGNHREVEVLRQFRDEYLLTNKVSRAFVRFYYRYSPPVANFIRERESLKAVVRIMLLPVMKFAKFVLGR